MFEALVLDIQESFKSKRLGRAGRRLNYEMPGMTSLFRVSGRRAKRITEAPFKDQVIAMDQRWGELKTWRLIHQESGKVTESYFLSAMDLRIDYRGEISWKAEERRIYLFLFYRTLWMSGFITILCLALGYPIAFLLATLPPRHSNLLLILVLLHSGLLCWSGRLRGSPCFSPRGAERPDGIFGQYFEDSRLQMIHNKFGTFVAMTHILLPFMILPLYSVMKTIPLRTCARRGLSRIDLSPAHAGLYAQHRAGYRRRVYTGLYSVDRLLHHAGVGRRANRYVHFEYHCPSYQRNVELGPCRGPRGYFAGPRPVAIFLYDRIVGVNNMKLDRFHAAAAARDTLGTRLVLYVSHSMCADLHIFGWPYFRHYTAQLQRAPLLYFHAGNACLRSGGLQHEVVSEFLPRIHGRGPCKIASL